MRNKDKYINVPARDAIGKTIDPFTSIQEDRISNACIKSVAKKLNVSESLVEEIHNFQWAKVKEGAESFKLMHISKFFKLRLSKQKAPHYLDQLKKELSDLEEKMICATSSEKTKIAKQKESLQVKINLLETQINKCFKNKNP